MIADMLSNNKLNSIVTELFARGRDLNISLLFNFQSFFKLPKDVRLNINHLYIAINHSSDIEFKNFMNLYKRCTAKAYSFLVLDATLALDNPLGFRKNILERI